MRIIGYAFNADTHCPDCTRGAFELGQLVHGIDAKHYVDEHALPARLQEKNGDGVHPIFDIDENAGSEYCGDCLAKLLED